jgi:type VI secretion system protein ImpH
MTSTLAPNAAAEAPPAMPGQAGRAADQRAGAETLAHIAARPTAYDLFRAMRLIEREHPHLPLLGDALRPVDEPFRFAEEPSLTFAPAAITALEAAPVGPPRLVQRVIGFLGPNGALPIHLTEYTRERLLHHNDPTVLRFLGMLLHRFGLFFYRAWARSSPVVSLDRGQDSSLVRQLGSVVGIGEATLRRRDAVGDFAKLHFVGRLARSVRDADGLESWLRLHFRMPVQVEQFCGHWMQLDDSERSRLTALGQQGLGRGAVLGRQMWDVQHKFRIVIGPLPWSQFAAMMPGASPLAQLRSMVRQYVGFEFNWDVRLILRAGDVPEWRLGAPGGAGQLGRTSWLNSRRKRSRDADELVMNVESLRMAEAV